VIVHPEVLVWLRNYSCGRAADFSKPWQMRHYELGTAQVSNSFVLCAPVPDNENEPKGREKIFIPNKLKLLI